MLKNIGNVVFEIECDNCHSIDWSKTREGLEELLLTNAWYINEGGRKYKHLCFKCQSSRQKRNNFSVFIKQLQNKEKE